MPDLGRIAEPFKALIQHIIGRKLDYHALYPCTVAGQSGNTLSLVPDDDRAKGFGVIGVDIKPGMPGYEVTVPSGARVLLGFEAGDPTRPYCALWQSGTDVTTLTFDSGSDAIARVDDSVNAGYLFVHRNGAGTQTIDVTYYPAGSVGLAAANAALAAAQGAGDTGHVESMTFGLITSGNTKLLA